MRIYKEVAQDPTLPQGFSITFRSRFWKKINKDGPVPVSCPELGACWIWTAKAKRKGYGAINSKGDGNTIEAHRASWILHNGEIPDGLSVLHRCDTPACVNPSHLFLGDQTDNLHDMILKGRSSIKNVLSESTVEAIREQWATGGFTQRQLAHQHGCSQPYVSELLAHKKRR